MSEEPSGLKNLQRAGAYGVLIGDKQVLLVRATGSAGRWWLPGGGIQFGEAPIDCLIREFQEETGLVVAPTALIDVVSDVMAYPERGLRVHTTRVLYRVQATSGALRAEVGGSTDTAQWHAMDGVLGLPLVPFVGAVLNNL